MTPPDSSRDPLPDDVRRDLCRVRLDDVVFRLPEFARDEYRATWTSRLNGLLATDITKAELYVKALQTQQPALSRSLAVRDPANLRGARGCMTTVIMLLVVAVAAALAGRWYVIQQAGGPAAVSTATEMTRVAWEYSMPGLLLGLAALTWLRPSRRLLILCSVLAFVLAVTGLTVGLGVPLWVLILSAGIVLMRAFRRPS